MRRLALVVLTLGARTAGADRGVHGSLGAGGSLLLAGHEGDRLRTDLQLDLEPHSRYGGSLAWRWFDQDHRGAVTAGLVFEAAAARPRLVVDLHVDLGADLDQRAPVLGGGLRNTLTIVGPLGIALDAGAYLVLDGTERSRLVVATNALLVARW
jgi:hypothetical protein